MSQELAKSIFSTSAKAEVMQLGQFVCQSFIHFVYVQK